MKKQSSSPVAAAAAAAIVFFITFSCEEQQMLSIVQAHFLPRQFSFTSTQSLVVTCGFVKEALQVALPVFIGALQFLAANMSSGRYLGAPIRQIASLTESARAEEIEIKINCQKFRILLDKSAAKKKKKSTKRG